MSDLSWASHCVTSSKRNVSLPGQLPMQTPLNDDTGSLFPLLDL